MAESTPPQAKDSRALRSPARGVSALLARTDSTPGTWVKSFVVVALGLVVGAIITGSGPAAILAIVLALCAAQAQFSAPHIDHEAKLKVLPADGDGDARTARAELTLNGGNETGRAIIEVAFPGTRPQTVVVAYSSTRKIRLSAPSLRSGPTGEFHRSINGGGPNRGLVWRMGDTQASKHVGHGSSQTVVIDPNICDHCWSYWTTHFTPSR